MHVIPERNIGRHGQADPGRFYQAHKRSVEMAKTGTILTSSSWDQTAEHRHVDADLWMPLWCTDKLCSYVWQFYARTEYKTVTS